MLSRLLATLRTPWMTTTVGACLALLLSLISLPAAEATDWTQFRGPTRDGHSSESGLVRTWSETGPREVWKVPSGASFSGLTVVGDRIYTMDSDGEKEYVVALSATTGKRLWQTPVGDLFTNNFGDGPRSTPTYDASGTLYVVSSRGTLLAINAEDGKVQWSFKFPDSFGAKLPNWAFTSSPLVVDDRVVVETGGTGARAVAAFDKKSGKLAWTALEDQIVYSSPIEVEIDGLRQLVFLTKAGLHGLSLDGKVLWSSAFMPDLGIKPASPVFIAPNLIFASASYDGGAKVVRLGRKGEAMQAETVWEGRTMMRNHFNTSVALDGYLYGFDQAILKCVDAKTGKTAWVQRGLGKGSLIAADGLLVILSERGQLVLAEATPEGYRELATHQPLTGRSWTQPSLADGRLYLRNGEAIVALDLRAGG